MKKFILLIAVVALLSLNGISQAITIETVAVGNVGNAADTTGYGSVGYGYNIGKYELTTGQYTAFLNSVAATDTYGLYNTNMADTSNGISGWGCNIKRTGNSGSYSYTVGNGSQTDITNWADRPVNWVNFWDACRFANWLGNGQPTGLQNASTTEDGAYTMTPNGITNNTITRNAGATWVVTSEDEWYKAAYYDPNKDGIGGYWLYPTKSDTAPVNQVLSTDPGNSANYYISGSGYAIGKPYNRTNVGEFENSASAYGTFDQGGNVWEWNEAILYDTRYIRGGSFSYINNLQSSDRYGIFPDDVNYFNVGFRVSEVPEPSTTIILLGGIVGLLGVRRRNV